MVKFRGIDYFESTVNIQTKGKANKEAKDFRNKGFNAFIKKVIKTHKGKNYFTYSVYRSYKRKR